MKKVILLFFLSGCSSIYHIRYMDTSFSGEREQWMNSNYYLGDFLSCENVARNILTTKEMEILDDVRSSKDNYKRVLNKYSPVYYKCLYDKGYRFKPEIGYCSYWKDKYICQNKDKYFR